MALDKAQLTADLTAIFEDLDVSKTAAHKAAEFADAIDLYVASDSNYVWLKVPFVDTTAEQTFITGTGELSLLNLDSAQTALPVFSGKVIVTIGQAYQDRQCYISTQPFINAGNVQFGVKLSDAGADGVAYFDISIRQL